MSTWIVVEDEPDLYDTLLALFEIWSVDGVAFTDGTDAIEWIEDVDRDKRAVSNIPELALLDIRLPGISGPDIGHRLRKSPVLGNIAIVLTTAYKLSPQEEREAVARAEADMLIYKPLPTPKELRQVLQDVIANRSATAEVSPGPSRPAKTSTRSPKPIEQPKPAEQPKSTARSNKKRSWLSRLFRRR